MIQNIFETMINESGLTLIQAMTSQLRFVVCLQVGGRFQNDTLEFGRDEFLDMTEQQAITHIRACESRLEQASRTQQGVIAYPKTKTHVTQHSTVLSPIASTVGYPAH